MNITYTNPVWPAYFADPFVLKVGQTYYAYGTAQDAQNFPVLRSNDLVNWQSIGNALTPLTNPKTCAYWAPEVAIGDDGRFYMYYSATTSASDEHHRLRVAIAENPAGPFVDSGKEIFPDAGFTIDASPFRDPQTGRRFLYCAMDFTSNEPHGTGLAMAELESDMMTLRQPLRFALRASCDWQIYQRNRDYKGRVWGKWHCVEGPFVVFHKNKYYLLYSGGAWYTENYGIGFAVADSPLGPWRDDFAPHGPYVLKTTPEVLGPGHASVTIAPDNKTLVLVYHAWDQGRTARHMCIDPLLFTHDGPRCDGPSITPRTL